MVWRGMIKSRKKLDKLVTGFLMVMSNAAVRYHFRQVRYTDPSNGKR